MVPLEIPWGDMLHVGDPGAGPAERAEFAEAEYLTAPPRRRGRTWSAVLIGVGIIWEDGVIGYLPRAGRPCPACGDHPAGRCLVCSASSHDPAQWPMTDLRERSRILAGPLKGRVRKARTRRERRASSRTTPVTTQVERRVLH